MPVPLLHGEHPAGHHSDAGPPARGLLGEQCGAAGLHRAAGAHADGGGVPGGLLLGRLAVHLVVVKWSAATAGSAGKIRKGPVSVGEFG